MFPESPVSPEDFVTVVAVEIGRGNGRLVHFQTVRVQHGEVRGQGSLVVDGEVLSQLMNALEEGDGKRGKGEELRNF